MKVSDKNKVDEVDDFIQRRFPRDCNWMDGNCLYFAKILNWRFPKYIIWYMSVSGHFIVAKDNINYYDWAGRHWFNELSEAEKNGLIKLSDINPLDSSWYDRILRDCFK